MKALLDTHILLWWLADDLSLPPLAAQTIANPNIDVFVSSATAWEIAIKRAAGRLEAPGDLLGALDANNFESLSITVAHALAAGALPEHHSDPFDRMLIAQARTEALTLITVDHRFPEYDVEILPLD